MIPRTIALLVLCSVPLSAEVIFTNNFDGTGGLHGAAPDIRPGTETWVASGQFTAGGSVTASPTSGGSATLAFTPANGLIYTLDARLSATAANPSNEWLAVGFAHGQSNIASGNTRFIDTTVVGRAWMLFRAAESPAAPNNVAFLGTGTATNAGTTGGSNWVGWTGGTGGTIDLRIVLDTTGGAGTWTATWYAKRPADAEFTNVRPTATLLDEGITSVGFAKSNTAVTGTLLGFSLSATGDGPPPATDPLVTFIPVTDGDPATDENGYAGSAINSVAFAQDNLITVGNQQIIAYYRRHATDSGHPANNTVVIGRRNTGETQWELFPTNFLSFNINDTHNVISCAIDGDGFLHMSWGMHDHPLLYARSDAPVTGTDPIQMVSLGTAGMTGQEGMVSYPIFKTLPDGDLVFLFRMGRSGNGDWYLHRYNTSTTTWSPIHTHGNGNTRPFIQGRGQNPNNCFYPDRLTLGPDGMLHLSGVFRYNTSSPTGESGYQTNHRYVYLRSPDRGDTWQRSNGSPISLPVVNNASFLNLGADHVPEIVKDLPEGHSIMNESGMTTDSAGRPIIANWWADNAASGDHTRQYHLFFHDGATWHQRTVSARNIDNPATKFAESQLGNSWVGRPVVLTDADDRIIVLYNDNRFPGITAVFSLPLAEDPGRNHWSRVNLTHEILGFWEVTYDEGRWKQDGVLQMLYQKLPGMGMSYAWLNNSTPVAVAEWDVRAYFTGPIQWKVDTITTPGQAAILAPACTGFRYDLRTSTNLDFSAPPVETRTGDGTWQEFGAWPMDEPRRFWQLQRTEEATNDL